jgi:FlaA1/EpsC-like NDP-sugar epimerase
VILLVVAVVAATFLRYDFHFATNSWLLMALLLIVASGLLVTLGWLQGLYTGRWLRGSFEETRALAMTAGGVTVGMFLLDLGLGHPLPASAMLAAGPIVLGAMVATRPPNRPGPRAADDDGGEAGSRVLVFGAGDGANDVVAAMLRDRARTYDPVALLDDDPDKADLRLHGVAVRGTRDDVAKVARATGADTLLIAVPSADGPLVRDLSERGCAAGLRVKVLPPVSELFEQAPGVHHIRPVSCADLMGRHEVEVDLDSISGYVTGRRVLVTGAGGSIGSELCRQLRRHQPETLIMLDRDESALHALQLSLEGRALLDENCLVVADIRDRQRMERVFAEHRPEVVFHTAALKHLPLLEMHPDEAVKTNVFGTLNLLAIAAEQGVRRFVNISTDKAADPISVLGYSKRVAERITAWYDAQVGAVASAARRDGEAPDRRFLSVRFGNVLGSRGSVLTTFHQQLADAHPLTVTDPDVTRYFMTVEEAVRLVIQAGAVGSGGQVLVLDMGKPVRIVEVARRLIAESGQDVGIEYTGLRPGEKLHECLLGAGERDTRPVHPQISHVPVPPLASTDVIFLSELSERGEVIEGLRSAAAVPILRPRTPCTGLPLRAVVAAARENAAPRTTARVES